MRTLLVLLFLAMVSGCSTTSTSSLSLPSVAGIKQVPKANKSPTRKPTATIQRRRSELEKIINTGINGQKATVIVQKNTVRAQISNSILFGFDKYQVKPQFRNTIKRLSLYLKKYPAITLIVEGHTDKTGKASYNKSLSLKRANAVKTLFTAYGVKANRIRAFGQGENHPIPGANNQKNRRVEIIFQERKGTKYRRPISRAKAPVAPSFTGSGQNTGSTRYPLTIKAGFDKNNPPRMRERQMPNFSLSLFISPNKTVYTGDFPVLVYGASKNRKAHTARVQVTASINISTTRTACIIGTCLSNNKDLRTGSTIIPLNIPPHGIAREEGVVKIRIGEKLMQGSGFFAGGDKRFTSGRTKITYKVLSWH